MKRLTVRDFRVYDHIWLGKVPGLPSSTMTALVEQLLRDGRACGHNPRLADLGCGIGRNALHAARLGVEVVAVDHHPRAVSMLRVAGADLQLSVVHADLLDWLDSQPDQAYDAIVCFDALHHLSPDPEVIRSAQQKVRRVVCRGGHVLVTLLCDISYSSGERPSGRLSVDAEGAADLLDTGFTGAECLKKTLCRVHKPAIVGFDETASKLVPTSYSAHRVLRWFRLAGADFPENRL